MTFLNSIYLAALAAITIPLLIHFLSRRRIKVIDFSSLRFLFQMQKTRLRWLRIRDLILLIIRILVIAMIALAFARPALTGRHGSSHAPASVVLLLDNSPSSEKLSSAGIVYDDIKQGAIQIIDLLNANDEISIATLSGQPAMIGTYSDFSRVKEALYATKPGVSPPDIREGLARASGILAASHNLNREIYVLSDFQSGHCWEMQFDKTLEPAYHYFLISYGNDESENIGFTNIQFPPQLLAPAEEFVITASASNYTDQAYQDRLIELFLDGIKKAQTTIDLKPQGRATTQFNVTLDTPGRHRGYFEIEDDDYTPDNRLYFDFQIPAKISALGVADKFDDLRTLSSCFGENSASYISFAAVTTGEFNRLNLSSFDVIILDNISALSQANFNSLNDFLTAGGGLFIILGSNSNIDSYRDFLDKKAGITAGPRISASGGGDGAYFDLSEFDLTQPIFKIYSPQNRESAQIPPMKVYNFSSLSGGEPMASLSDKRVILAASNKARAIVMGAGLDRVSSDIALHSFVVPFMIRTVEFLASEISQTKEYYTSGEPATINIQGDTRSASLKLVGPEGDITTPVSRGAYGAFVNLPQVGSPGFYSIINDSDTAAIFSVNHDSTESTARIVLTERLKEIFGRDASILNGKSDIKTGVTQAKFGLELWKYCLAIALLLLIIESLLVRERKK